MTCSQLRYHNKFFTESYIDIEFDELVAVPDTDHANFISNIHWPGKLRFDWKSGDLNPLGVFHTYFFRFVLKYVFKILTDNHEIMKTWTLYVLHHGLLRIQEFCMVTVKDQKSSRVILLGQDYFYSGDTILLMRDFLTWAGLSYSGRII